MSLQRILGGWWSSVNGSLKGHQLLIISPIAPPPEWVDKVKKKYSDLDVVHYAKNPWGLDRSATTDIDWKNVTVLLTGPLVPTIEEAPKLEVVQLQSAGANYLLDHPTFKDTDVAFCTANGVHGPQIAEWVIATYLASQHYLPKYLEQMKDGNWERVTTGVDDAVSGRVGILGYGSIGRQVAKVAKALGMDVIAYTNGRRPTPESRRDTGYIVPGTGDPEGTFPSKWLSGADGQFDEFLSSGLDLLVVAVPLTPSTKDLISESQFKILSEKKTFLSNIARGPIVNTDALIKALDDGLIRGAALDVTDPEPLPKGHPLWHKPNTIITPHVSGNSNDYNKRVLDILELNLQKLSEGKKEFVNKVNKKEGY
ncbi:D-isomer specific 2-hydroxyacid dehydrogenase [Xylariales sp. AK1849]|nr:D-isomer specific 2-hydroxyacid dehydrogenase [Xylariales sp. AK1849]